MNSSSDNPTSGTPRRQFIGELAAGAAALAAVACAPAATASTASQAPAPAPGSQANGTPAPRPLPIPPQTWDATWMERITAKHKVVFDSPEIVEGAALYHAMSYLQSVKDVFGTGDSDASVVVCLRHAAVPLLYNDAMWEKYDLGGMTKTLDQKTKTPVKRNIYYQRLNAEGKPIEDRPTPTIKSLASRGVIFVGCDMATRGVAYQVGRATKQEMRDVYAELKANLVAGATLMPTGIFATLLAQDAGCSFFKST
ncbi:MAG: hypothetical protein K0S86_5891 [Geminicoccaceae bacterium]|nr:hypothetical protein [Geminicoccaceae bacterium]